MAQCQGCGAHVSDRYARVRGDNDDIVRECRHCPRDDVERNKLTTDTGHVGGTFEDVDGGGA